MDDNDTGERRGQRRANALCRDDSTLRHVEAAGAAHEIGDDHRKHRSIDARADPIQQLHADEPIRVVGQGVETSPNAQNRERDQE